MLKGTIWALACPKSRWSGCEPAALVAEWSPGCPPGLLPAAAAARRASSCRQAKIASAYIGQANTPKADMTFAAAGLWSELQSMTAETMTAEGIISVQAMTARIACRWMNAGQLEAVSDSIDRAARLPARFRWERKAAAS